MSSNTLHQSLDSSLDSSLKSDLKQPDSRQSNLQKPDSKQPDSRQPNSRQPNSLKSQPEPALADFKVGVDTVIFSVDTDQNRLLVLLVMRHEDPFSGHWSLPGTLVRVGESLEAAADRVLTEKIRVNNLYLEQLFTFGSPNRDPREAKDAFNVRYLSVSHFALVRYEDTALIADGVSGIAWYPLSRVPQLAFDHNQILTYGYQRLRSKLEYSPVAFDVLPETFTLSDVYQLYATVLGENFSDYSNFRTRLLKLGILQDTKVKTSRGAGRPASLYRFDAEAFEPLKDKPMVFL